MVRWWSGGHSDITVLWSVRCPPHVEVVVTLSVLLSPGHMSHDTGPHYGGHGAPDTGHCDTQVDTAPGQRGMVTVTIHSKLQ